MLSWIASIGSTPLLVVGALAAVSVLVFIHEAGHFVVAKWFGVGVPVFSLGMGPRAFGITYRGTDYRVSWLPIGGYVTMAGADPFGEQDPDAVVDPSQDFMNKPVWQRLLVLLAGPAANLALPVVLFSVLYMVGQPTSDATIGLVSADSPAAQAGLQTGDRIVAIHNQPVSAWEDVDALLAAHAHQGTTLRVQRPGGPHTVQIDPGVISLEGPGHTELAQFGIHWRQLSPRVGVDSPQSPVGAAGLQTGDYLQAVDGQSVVTFQQVLDALATGPSHQLTYVRAPQTTPRTATVVQTPGYSPRSGDPWANPWGIAPADVYVGNVQPGSAADQAGLLPNDRMWSVDGVVVTDFYQIVRLVGRTAQGAASLEAAVRPLDLGYVRDGQLHHVRFTPTVQSYNGLGRTRYRALMGVVSYPSARVPAQVVVQRYWPHRALAKGMAKTMVVLRDNLTVLGGMMTGQSRVTDNLGGPVKIVHVVGNAMQSGGFAVANVLAAISLSLGLINLLPVPVLDGGQIMFYTIEWVRGRPLSLVLRERLQMIGVLVLFGLMILVSVSDVSDLFSGG